MPGPAVQRTPHPGVPGFPASRPLGPKPFVVAHPSPTAMALSRPAASRPMPYCPPPMTRAVGVQPKMATGAPPRPITPPPYRPQAALRPVQPFPALQPKAAAVLQRHVPHHAVAARGTAGGSTVIQLWRCHECHSDITYSYDHRSYCTQYHHRVYETGSDRQSNYYDRPHGGSRTRSGSFERQYSDGTDERRHYHENLHTTGYVESRRGYYDRYGQYHSY